MINLDTLSLTHNQLTSIPSSIGDLNNLKYLNLYYNDLSSIPESIGELNSLVKLELNVNNLTTIPESIGNLTALEYLWLNNNQLNLLPESICDLPSNCNIVVGSNNFCEEYHYDCIDWGDWDWGTQDQSNCCEGPNGEPNWTQCD